MHVCLYVLCSHLLGKGWPLGSRLWCLTVSLSLSHWYPGQVWYLIVSIPDLCTLTYFYGKCPHDANFLFCFNLKSNCLLELTAIFNETTTINIKEQFLKFYWGVLTWRRFDLHPKWKPTSRKVQLFCYMDLFSRLFDLNFFSKTIIWRICWMHHCLFKCYLS